jgi:hypothetical protein
VLALVAVPVAAGVLLGYARGGRLRHLADLSVRAPWLLLLAAGLQFVHFDVAGTREAVESALHVSLMVPIFGLVGAWCLVNLPGRPRLGQVAVALVLLGGAANALAIAANGRMPYSESALVAAHVSDEQRARGERSPKHVAADATTRLRWLGDVVPVPPVQKVVSAGDVVLLLGVAGVVAAGMRGPVGGNPATSPAGARRRALPSEPGGTASQATELVFDPGRRFASSRRARRATGHTGDRRSGPSQAS